MTEYASVSTLYGRAALLREIVGSESPITVLVGDSGIGKTELLVHAQLATASGLAPPPIEVSSRDGSLVEAMADSLASALAEVVVDGDHGVQLRRVQEFVVELGKQAGGFVAQVVTEAFMHQLKKHLGDRVVDLGAELTKALKNSKYETIGSRIGDIRNVGVLSELVVIAIDVRELSGCSQLSLALDRIEVLPEGDVRLLADLARILPASVVLKVGLRDTTAAGSDTLRLLSDLADDEVAKVLVGPLSESAVREYLIDANLDPAIAPEVLLHTGGYPLHVGDLVRHMATGGNLTEATTNAKFGRMIQSRWDALTPITRQVARQLCLTDRPLPLKSTLTTLGVQDSAWWDMVETLRTERIFSQTVGGMPWFHEQRRRWLVDKFTEEEKVATALRMLPAVCDVARGPEGWGYCTTLAKLMQIAGGSKLDVKLGRVDSLSDAELAIAGAALELGANNARHADPEMLLTHARRAFSVGGDLVAALDSMDERGLLHVRRISEFHATGVLAEFDILEEVAVGGLCQERLGRLPVRDLAQVLWETSLGKDAPPVHLAVCGVGWVHPGDEIKRVHTAKMRSSRTIGRFYGCLVVGDLQGVPVYAVASTAADQVARLWEAWSGATGEIGGRTFRVRSLLPVPGERMRGRRWSVAADDLLDGRAPGAKPVGAGMSLEDELEMTVAARHVVRSNGRLDERLVADMDEDMHIYYQEIDDETTIVQVLGQAPGVTHVSSLDPWWIGDTLVRLRFAQQLSLPAELRIGTISTGHRRMDKHPLQTVADRFEESVLAFNQHHDRHQVDAREERLEEWLLPLMESRYRDVVALYEGAELTGLSTPTHWEVFLLAVKSSRNPLPGIYATMAKRRSSRSIVHYKLEQRPSADTHRVALNRAFPDSVGVPIFSSELASVLAELSGYSRDDLQL